MAATSSRAAGESTRARGRRRGGVRRARRRGMRGGARAWRGPRGARRQCAAAAAEAAHDARRRAERRRRGSPSRRRGGGGGGGFVPVTSAAHHVPSEGRAATEEAGTCTTPLALPAPAGPLAASPLAPAGGGETPGAPRVHETPTRRRDQGGGGGGGASRTRGEDGVEMRGSPAIFLPSVARRQTGDAQAGRRRRRRHGGKHRDERGGDGGERRRGLCTTRPSRRSATRG